jgi:prolyl-tRNA editing enzyme YbaK/EbsC (Cys-tRNA(Pro) deacylase)
MTELATSAARVQAALTARGMALRVIELPASTRSAAEAALAIGCGVAQIVKSIVFRGTRTGEPVLVLASGSKRIDEARVAEAAGEAITMADATYVRERTGFAIGGVPPVGHAGTLRTLLDRSLLDQEELWAAAGTPHAVFRLTPDELIRLTGAQASAITVDP